MSSLADAYSAGATAWADGPALVYRRLAELLVAFSPVPLAGHRVLDHGSGTGVGSAAALAADARVIATDIAPGMLGFERTARPPSVAGDALALPFRSNAFDVVLAAFSLNHFDDPATALREARRVAPVVIASTYAEDDDHPAKHAVDSALAAHGWSTPPWYSQLKAAMRLWGTVDAAAAVIERAGLDPIKIERVEIEFDQLCPDDLITWRLGMAQTAPYFAELDRDLITIDQAQ